MATVSILQDISIYLRGLLIGATASLPPGERLTQQMISFDSPVAFADGPGGGNVRLSLYLYHIERNAHLNNQPLLRIGNEQFVRPYFVDLNFLLTPVTNAPAENLVIMGRVIQVFSANGIIREPFLQLAREPGPAQAHLRMLSYDLDAMNKLWGALAKPYRMSVAYEVTPVPIESVSRGLAGPPVAEAILDVQQMNGGS